MNTRDPTSRHDAARGEGHFDRIENGSVFGWARDSNGRPVAVVIRVNGAIAASVEPKRRWSRWLGRERCDFQVPLRLSHGDRVEIIVASTGAPLPGGVRCALDPTRRLRISVVAPVNEEARHLIEWLAFYRALGIESFVLGDNGGTGRSSELLQALEEVGLVTRHDWVGRTPAQMPFYLDVLPKLQGVADVCLIFDVDEFARPLNGRTDIATAVAEIFSRPEVSAAAVSWVTYGSSGRVEPGEGLIIERFTHRCPDDFSLNRGMKSMLRPERFVGMLNPHVVSLSSGDYVDDRGEVIRLIPLAFTERVTWNSLRLDHFVLKSRREFEAKVRRGRAHAKDPAEQRREDFFISRDRNEVFDPMPAEFVERTKLEIGRLRTLLVQSSRWPELRDRL